MQALRRLTLTGARSDDGNPRSSRSLSFGRRRRTGDRKSSLSIFRRRTSKNEAPNRLSYKEHTLANSKLHQTRVRQKLNQMMVLLPDAEEFDGCGGAMTPQARASFEMALTGVIRDNEAIRRTPSESSKGLVETGGFVEDVDCLILTMELGARQVVPSDVGDEIDGLCTWPKPDAGMISHGSDELEVSLVDFLEKAEAAEDIDDQGTTLSLNRVLERALGDRSTVSTSLAADMSRCDDTCSQLNALSIWITDNCTKACCCTDVVTNCPWRINKLLRVYGLHEALYLALELGIHDEELQAAAFQAAAAFDRVNQLNIQCSGLELPKVLRFLNMLELVPLLSGFLVAKQIPAHALTMHTLLWRCITTSWDLPVIPCNSIMGQEIIDIELFSRLSALFDLSDESVVLEVTKAMSALVLANPANLENLVKRSKWWSWIPWSNSNDVLGTRRTRFTPQMFHDVTCMEMTSLTLFLFSYVSSAESVHEVYECMDNILNNVKDEFSIRLLFYSCLVKISALKASKVRRMSDPIVSNQLVFFHYIRGYVLKVFSSETLHLNEKNEFSDYNLVEKSIELLGSREAFFQAVLGGDIDRDNSNTKSMLKRLESERIDHLMFFNSLEILMSCLQGPQPSQDYLENLVSKVCVDLSTIEKTAQPMRTVTRFMNDTRRTQAELLDFAVAWFRK